MHDKPVAKADKVRNIQLLFDNDTISTVLPLKKTIPQVISNTIAVRIAVARSEFTSFNPALAKIAVNAAKNADNNAYISHVSINIINIRT